MLFNKGKSNKHENNKYRVKRKVININVVRIQRQIGQIERGVGGEMEEGKDRKHDTERGETDGETPEPTSPGGNLSEEKKFI